MLITGSPSACVRRRAGQHGAAHLAYIEAQPSSDAAISALFGPPARTTRMTSSQGRQRTEYNRRREPRPHRDDQIKPLRRIGQFQSDILRYQIALSVLVEFPRGENSSSSRIAQQDRSKRRPPSINPNSRHCRQRPESSKACPLDVRIDKQHTQTSRRGQRQIERGRSSSFALRGRCHQQVRRCCGRVPSNSASPKRRKRDEGAIALDVAKGTSSLPPAQPHRSGQHAPAAGAPQRAVGSRKHRHAGEARKQPPRINPLVEYSRISRHQPPMPSPPTSATAIKSRRGGQLLSRGGASPSRSRARSCVDRPLPRWSRAHA